ncbi:MULTISPECIES: hypothetical protein [Bacteroidales]|uniref:hypothetical protein n=1 Tax=Bacteroides pyogenes TaxID=310300 RepID=UPI002F939198
MKKKIMFSMFTLVTVGLASFTGYKTLSQNKTVVNLLGENIEALTMGENGGGGIGAPRGYYEQTSGACSAPCDYKKWVSCKLGGNKECFPSDCC